MPALSAVARHADAGDRIWPIALVVALAAMGFLGFLGSVELWGKREQRAAAEAIDTLEHQRWLVARIQERPRLEKPPLPRWLIAAVMGLSSRRDEWMLRLPGALAGVATVLLVHRLGRRMAGPAVGLASALCLCSLGFFVGEMRQASNDAALAFLTTLALYSAWRTLHGGPPSISQPAPRIHPATGNVPARAERPSSPPRAGPPTVPLDRSPLRPAPALRAGGWRLVFYAALGLGVLTKGPVILLVVGVTVLPYLLFLGQLGPGLRCLASLRGSLLFAALALWWPIAVLLHEPGALKVWALEMTEKIGLSRNLDHRGRGLFLVHWPALILPWPIAGCFGAALPFLVRGGRKRLWGPGITDHRASARPVEPAPLWFAWWWAIGNLVMFSLWAISKPNYYLPCLPGAALLIGATWVYVSRSARASGGARGSRSGRALGIAARAARLVLTAQWAMLLLAAALTPLLARQWIESSAWPWLVPMTLPMLVGVPMSIFAWKRGADVMSLAPLAGASVLCILVAYGKVAPAENFRRGHRAFAEAVARVVPPETRSLAFFNEIDEGLAFYVRGLTLAPVPEDFPRRRSAYERLARPSRREGTIERRREVEAGLRLRDQQALRAWLEDHDPAAPYLLIRKSLYDRHADDLAGRVAPLIEEGGVKRNELVLVKALDPPRHLWSDRRAISTRR
jgi:4-amino-4-deoxy-L-arabinose transferase-like glycosyltransferase